MAATTATATNAAETINSNKNQSNECNEDNDDKQLKSSTINEAKLSTSSCSSSSSSSSDFSSSSSSCSSSTDSSTSSSSSSSSSIVKMVHEKFDIFSGNKEEQHFSQIIDRLYLTSANNITDANLFKYRITHIINATRTVPLRRKFRCLRVNILDSAMEQISTHFDMVADFINDGLACGGSVVIHCISGISRSSTLVIAFLMKHRNMSLKDAFDLTRSKRWFIRPNIGFFKQLVEYEKELFKSNTVRMVWCEASQSHVPDFILEDKSNYKYFYLCVKK